ncbi:helix-turn-helix domain-containing protein [uncultured Microbulbifer sp.]|uniref:transcriptional regulator n=1 Tax=uncultured Microbulbifer sp. TaxID=348147 RepID=UPI00260CF579|nr:helix-turn-helix domain-containing protein [uncultured Microbulbifer sp.]
MEPIQLAIRIAGTQQKLADALGIKSQGQVTQWVTGRRPIPPKRCIPIERITNGVVTRYDLRPDIFGPAPQECGGDITMSAQSTPVLPTIGPFAEKVNESSDTRGPRLDQRKTT